MEIVSIRCLSCRRGWKVTRGWSVYEQQAQESSPCPHCGTYTLCCTSHARSEKKRRKAVAQR
ncbi:MAG: hypothetical protein U0840_09860 [Gemmataceae bacterium]